MMLIPLPEGEGRGEGLATHRQAAVPLTLILRHSPPRIPYVRSDAPDECVKWYHTLHRLSIAFRLSADDLTIRVAHRWAEVYVATATRGEQGMLGTHGQEVTRRTCPGCAKQSCAPCSRCMGPGLPSFLGYRDQEVSHASADALVAKIATVMAAIRPDVVITFGPMGYPC